MNGILVVALVCGILALGLNLVAIGWLLRSRAAEADTTLHFVADPLDGTTPSPLVPRHRRPVEVSVRG